MRVPLILTAAIAAAAALPAAAQVYAYDDSPTVDEVIVAPLGPYRSGYDGMSQRVSFADLDLTTYSGQQVLQHRVRVAADDVCRALEGDGRGAGSGVVPSCADQAVRETRPQMRVAINSAIRSRSVAYNDLGAYPYDWRD